MALGAHILNDDDLDDYEPITKVLAEIVQSGKTVVAAHSNFGFLKSYPALLPFVTGVEASENRSSSIETVYLLNILI